jgi:hypothetical protein
MLLQQFNCQKSVKSPLSNAKKFYPFTQTAQSSTPWYSIQEFVFLCFVLERNNFGTDSRLLRDHEKELDLVLKTKIVSFLVEFGETIIPQKC